MQTNSTATTETCPWCRSPIAHTQFIEIEAKIREKEKRRLDQQRQELEQQYRREAAEQKTALEEKAKKDAKALIAEAAKQRDAALEKLKQVEEEAEDAKKKAVEAEVLKVREVLDRDHELTLLKQKAEFARKEETTQKKVNDLKRQLEGRTANDLGDGAEIDLFETLRDAFPDDRITRIAKGQPGADIKVEVLHRGEVCGVILIDSKNRKAWQGTFATKLREDQVQAEADHAILSTTAFPTGKKELCIESGVIVASPGRVRELVMILRSQVIKSHLLGMSNESRAEKRENLYRFITSEHFQQKVDEVARLADEILELDVKEQNQHRRTWENRGRMLKQQQRAVGDIDVEIAAILETSPDDSRDRS